MNNIEDIILSDYQTSSLLRLIQEGLTSPNGCTFAGKPTEEQRTDIRRLKSLNLISSSDDEETRICHVSLTDVGRAYVERHFEFKVQSEAGSGNTAEAAPEVTKKSRGPKGMKLAGVMNYFPPLAAQSIVKVYKGQQLRVEVAADGSCHVNGAYYTSLSKAASAVTGQDRINGRKFFGVKREAAAQPANA